jgi:alpha-beta hydrolase superfamily lysophospholipase
LFSFDFAGCGKGSAEYITLGYREKEDVKVVVDYLTKIEKIDSIILWGRSMGGATAILYLSDYTPPPKVNVLILDSPYADF